MFSHPIRGASLGSGVVGEFFYMEGTRPLTGPALPNLINAVKMLKSKSKSEIA